MQHLTNSTIKNSFVSCCSIFSKNLDLMYPTQICRIILPSNNIDDIIILYGLNMKINVFVPFQIYQKDDFFKFMVSSYCFVKKSKLENDDTTQLNFDSIKMKTLINNLNEWEKDYYTNLLESWNKLETNIIFDMDIIEDFKDKGFIASLLFKDYFIASYFFNRFSRKNNPQIKIDKKEYLIKIIPIQTKYSINKINKLTNINNVQEYLLSQLTNQLGIDKILINENSFIDEKIKDKLDPYIILFHPNTILSYNYRSLVLNTENIEYKDFFTKFINFSNYNHNIHWFFLNSKINKNLIIRCFHFKNIIIEKQLISEKKDLDKQIIKIKQSKPKELTKIAKDQKLIDSFLCTPNNNNNNIIVKKQINKVIQKKKKIDIGDYFIKRKRDDDGLITPSKIQKIGPIFETNNK